MRYSYYYRLSRHRQKVYRYSDSIEFIRLPRDHGLEQMTSQLDAALKGEDQRRVTRVCGALAGGLCDQLEAPPVRVWGRARRPSDDREELHGLYAPGENDRPAQITVWMRTARRSQIVAFKTFL